MTQRHMQLWNFLWERSEGVCRLCLKPLEAPIEIDHIVPRATGGASHESNLQLVHRGCNRRKQALPMDEAIRRITTEPLGHRPRLKQPFIHLILDPELLERLDDFRFGFRITSRSEAIRWLITAALDQNPIPEPERHEQPPKRRRSR